MRQLRDLERVKAAIERDGLDVPGDLMLGSYRWRAFAYANLFKDTTVSLEGKAILCDLAASLLSFHRICWSRRALVPLQEDRHMEMRALLQRTLLKTSLPAVARACIYQFDCLNNALFYTDDHVMSLIHGLAWSKGSTT